MDGTLSQMAVAGRDPLLAFARNLGPELRSHRSTGRDDLSVADQLAKIKGRVKQIQEREERDRRRQRRATRRAAAEGIAPEPQPETEVVSALSARLMWTKSVEARLQAESQALSAKIAREAAERKAAVATLTRDVLGPRGTDDMRITGKLAGAESEFGSKMRRGGLGVRGTEPEQHPTRPGRRGVLHGRRSVAEEAPQQRGPSPQAMQKAAERMQGGGRISAPPELGGREPIGCLPVEVMGRQAARKAKVPPSLARSTYVNHGRANRDSGVNNPQHHREWGKLQSALGGKGSADAGSSGRDQARKMYNTQDFGKLKGQIIQLQKEAARIDSSIGTRTRVLAVPSPAFPVRADDGPAFSKY